MQRLLQDRTVHCGNVKKSKDRGDNLPGFGTPRFFSHQVVDCGHSVGSEQPFGLACFDGGPRRRACFRVGLAVQQRPHSKISINGMRPELSSFLLDGTDINNVYNKTPGSVAGVLPGVEAVLEFQVLTNSYSAELGRSAGGVINAVTRAGTNQVHGSAFEFLRRFRLSSATSSAASSAGPSAATRRSSWAPSNRSSSARASPASSPFRSRHSCRHTPDEVGQGQDHMSTRTVFTVPAIAGTHIQLDPKFVI